MQLEGSNPTGHTAGFRDQILSIFFPVTLQIGNWIKYSNHCVFCKRWGNQNPPGRSNLPGIKNYAFNQEMRHLLCHSSDFPVIFYEFCYLCRILCYLVAIFISLSKCAAITGLEIMILHWSAMLYFMSQYYKQNYLKCFF